MTTTEEAVTDTGEKGQTEEAQNKEETADMERKSMSTEEAQHKLLEQIQPKMDEVLKRLGNEAFPNAENEGDGECIKEDQSKYFMDLCFQSQDALEELRKVLQEMELTEACTTLEQIPKQGSKEDPPPVEKTKDETLIEKPQPYRDVIQASSGTMVDCLQITPQMLDRLESLSVLNKDMISKILCRANRPDRVRCLLQFLKELGPKSLNGFITALRETKQDFLANILAANKFI